ncbi:hypothetical protein [Photobacterium iliopiscarium]|uniref:hypothetical protein n=1 Tax=Photobacterium iliopiscarium TaxID=56192 RepID=UPI0015E6A7A0|nr:hypothetical protein [Photobacterium iliopiscarium]
MNINKISGLLEERYKSVKNAYNYQSFRDLMDVLIEIKASDEQIKNIKETC